MSVNPAPELDFEVLGTAHVDRLCAIEQEAYPDPWTAGMFRKEIGNRLSHFFVGRLGGEIVGYAGFWLVLDEAHITKVTIAAPYRAQGLGVRLMGHLLHRARAAGAERLRLEVRVSNTPAIRLYAAHGFERLGIRRGYYTRRPEDAVVMGRVLTPPGRSLRREA